MTTALTNDFKYGEIHVYREFLPRTDEVEYTIYFRLEPDGEKQRIDLREPAETFVTIPEYLDVGSYLIGKFHQAVSDGLHRPAKNFVQ